ncbi:IucA/IucC family protein [Saccharopolyspora mangrovi]|uniref:IucA/IucC family protein n=1 Tax=Saccharopolyspora mangrovi TaxID=3082379 RepID=A0ABU6AB07_9PSEU|nr:IucA/IucC family protein [Saccharopolyspora sp. S2-29]MEB3368628.1 IucA/IucC family protein [Saccharopolyspora sp. S2-29]
MQVESAELVMRDLVDVLLQEELVELTEEAPGWGRIRLATGSVSVPVRPGGALQRYRFDCGPVLLDGSRPLTPAELLELVSADSAEVAGDLRAAVEHTEVLREQRASLDLAPRDGRLLAGERLAATRNRPFHPTARAAAGWCAEDVERCGPMRGEPLGLDWVAVRRDRLAHGGDPLSHHLAELVLSPAEQRVVDEAGDDHQAIPVHPWQFEHVLEKCFGEELADGSVVPLARGLGGFHPTSSIRTLTSEPESDRHVKLPLGVATLGATRLLPPRYLANAERAQRCMADVLERDPALAGRVALCDERIWAGWHDPDDEFGDRPGQLAAQVRVYPELDGLVLPMAALAAHEWDVLAPAISDRFDPAWFFGDLARSFCEVAFGFLSRGVLPELHGQNVVVQLRGGRAERFVLRDHDTLRLFPGWMQRAGTPDPNYLIKPGAPQSLRLDSAEALVGYLQTLGFQVNLYGIADALCRHFGLDERVLWARLHEAVLDCLPGQPVEVREVLREQLLRAEAWPSRRVLEPLLRQGRSSGVSMPAGAGAVPNPLLVGVVA